MERDAAEVEALHNYQRTGTLGPATVLCRWCGTLIFTPQRIWCAPSISNPRGCAREQRLFLKREANPEMRSSRLCDQCGSRFWPTGPNQKRCSPECKRVAATAWMRERHRATAPPRPVRECDICGTAFEARAENAVRCGSPACRAEAARRYRGAYKARERAKAAFL